MPSSRPTGPRPATTAARHVEVLPRAELSPARYRTIVDLCARAFEEPFAEILDAFPDATHVVASIDGAVVSHALWVPRTLTSEGVPLRSAYVEAVATEPRHQGRGHASAVLRALADVVASAGAFDVGALSPSDAAFYARLGWEPWRGPLAALTPDGRVEPTPDEEVMILRLPGAPPLDLDAPLVAPWREGELW